MTKTKEQFISNAIRVHGDKYTYDKVIYINNRTKITIVCPKHGDFNQTPDSHINGKNGCRKCANQKISLNLRKTQDEFIKEAQKVHGDKYDYSRVNYIDTDTYITIVCKDHGEFLQVPRSHTSGKRGCFKCNNNQTKSPEQFILDAKKIHGDRYDYSVTNYKTARINIDIKCKIHGVFNQSPVNHLKGHGCSPCNRRKDTEIFVIEAKEKHGNRYVYSKTNYITSNDNVIIICPDHGEFLQISSSHISGQGCPNCVNKTEGKIKRFLEENRIKFETQVKVDNKQFDFLINDDYILEIDGSQHFCDIPGQNKLIPTDRMEILANDVSKMESIIDYYPIVRLFQKSIWDDKYDWRQLILSLNNLEPGIIYIRSSEKELYKNHILNFNMKCI